MCYSSNGRTCLGQHHGGDKGDQDATKCPECKQSAEVLAAIRLAQEFAAVREHDGQQPADAVGPK
jgi:hypothetical protein